MKFGHNSTIGVKKKICKSCGKPCYWFSKQRCQQCSTIETTQARMEQATEHLIKEEDLQDLISDADTVVSRYVRMKDSDKDGNCQCYTCKTKLPWKQMQAGHYIKRSHLFLRWDADRNIRPQCEYCNCHKRGNLAVFAQNLEKESPGLPDILYEESMLIYKPTRSEIRQVILEYTGKIKNFNGKKN